MKKTVIVVTRKGLGTTLPGDADFGEEMLDKFFHTLEAAPEKPQAICFYTEGVKNTVKGSPHLLSLKVLEELGVKMVICQTCLVRYQLEGKVGVGKPAGMVEVVRLMAEAEKVITV